ncbi:Rap30/74 interaction domain-containing protein [Karstenula rhodostoma CBS 690.94]|uniref:Rap30/74 interaction domain-containing protein n=1 Tax=Karstenula rhodostoma CBS 690.94 TaxID=1392251 RepID=A0A9P4PJ87_9PLEO|nr:Rap30/74 interaction domain-containing protein [Karstenula rhodostoma CBS 690.94]
MNGAPPPPAAPGAAPVVKRRKPRAAASVLRAPQRPLKKVARTVTSLTQLNTRDAPNQPVSIDQLRREFIEAGAAAYPLVVTRKDLKELRHHVMRLHAKDHVNVQNPKQFTPPVRLHRRDPRAPPGGKEVEEEKEEDLEEAKERERQEEEREARRVKREGIQAQIAPTGATKNKPFGKKTEQKYRPDDTPEAKKRQLLRYEETLPWHLEDDDNKQTWVGLYEAQLSNRHVTLTVENAPGQHPVIQLAPLERWYKFNPKTKAKSTEDTELVKAKKDSYFEARERKKIKEEMDQQDASRARQLRTRVGGGADDEGRIKQLDDEDMPRLKREADADDIDFNVEEDFADDEEGLNGLFDGDDDTVKEAQEKLKRDQLQAAAFDLRDERQIWAEEEREKKEQEEKALEQEIRKSLVKREKNYDYAGSDSEYSETDSETERQRAKEEEEKKAAEQNGKAPEGDKTASGASTKGSSTPAPRSADINKKKRPAPGSPNLSEASGNESARKKHKKKHERNADGTRKVGPLRTGAASGSDSEMTDAGKSKKHKLKVRLGGTPGASPAASRAGSPAAQLNGSRAGSPAAPGGVPATPQTRLPSASEIYNALPPDGMPIQTLINKFRERVDKSNMNVFIKLVRAVASYDKGRGWLSPLPELPSDEQIAAATKPKPAAKAASPPA